MDADKSNTLLSCFAGIKDNKQKYFSKNIAVF